MFLWTTKCFRSFCYPSIPRSAGHAGRAWRYLGLPFALSNRKALRWLAAYHLSHWGPIYFQPNAHRMIGYQSAHNNLLQGFLFFIMFALSQVIEKLQFLDTVSAKWSVSCAARGRGHTHPGDSKSCGLHLLHECTTNINVLLDLIDTNFYIATIRCSLCVLSRDPWVRLNHSDITIPLRLRWNYLPLFLFPEVREPTSIAQNRNEAIEGYVVRNLIWLEPYHYGKLPTSVMCLSNHREFWVRKCTTIATRRCTASMALRTSRFTIHRNIEALPNVRLAVGGSQKLRLLDA